MTSDSAHGEAHMREVEHPVPSIGPRQYVIIGVILAVITAIELWVSYSPLGDLILPTLLILSAAKFVIVVAFFMHLRFDHPMLTRFFVFGFVLAAGILFALLALFGNDDTFMGDSAREARAVQGAGAESAGGDEHDGTAGGDVSVEHEIDVGLGEFFVDVPEQASAGGTQFNTTNEGAVPHNLRVIRTDVAPDALPVAGAIVDESQVDVVASVPDLNATQGGSATANLEPGSYLLICNVPGHYQLGMVAPLTVE